MNEITVVAEYSPEQIDLIKKTVASGTTDAELALFLHQCKRTGLDPLSNQIHCIKRKSKGKNGQWEEKVTIQTGIDGLRLIAERTGNYAPGDIEYRHDGGKLVSAIAIVRKLVGGQWFEVKAEAFLEEYIQTYYNRDTSKWEPMGLWKKMPRLMLAKCAESLALRKAFPAELSGLYTDDEMRQADPVKDEKPAQAALSSAEVKHIADTAKAKRQIMALLIQTGVPQKEIGDVGKWLIEWKGGDVHAALEELVVWDAQGLRFDSAKRQWVPVVESEAVNE